MTTSILLTIAGFLTGVVVMMMADRKKIERMKDLCTGLEKELAAVRREAELLNTPRPENLSALTPIVQDKRDASSRTLMKSKYCVKYELGLCPIHQKGIPGRLYITNNSRRFALEFDCKECEMRVVDLS